MYLNPSQMLPGLARFCKLLYRNPIVIVIPLFLTWYFNIQSCSPRSSLDASATPENNAGAFSAIPSQQPYPVSTPIPTPSLPPIPPPPPPAPEPPYKNPGNYSYVFYATNDLYACSALVNFHRLRNVLNSTVPGIVLASRRVTNRTITRLQNIGLEVIHDEPPPLANGSAPYYNGVLLKLRALRLHQIKPDLKRIQILDSDQLLLKNTDSLFELPDVEIAAPSAYWFDNLSVTTTLIVASLSDELWGIVDAAMHRISRDEYDMDLVNRVFKKRLMVLPGRYCTLNSHWEVVDLPGWFGGGIKTRLAETPEDMVRLYETAEILHFTAMGKPWDVDPDDVPRARPDAHPLFREQFKIWKDTANAVCYNS